MNKLTNIINILKKKKYKISVAESCTGGILSSFFTSLSGSSKIFDMGLVTYSNSAKHTVLKVPKKIIKQYGSVSKECCLSMVKNLYKISKSSVCVSITGIAGPNGGSKNKPVGLVYIGIKKHNLSKVYRYIFKKNSRGKLQMLAVNKALALILKVI